jgi:hypothetical protein
MKPPEKTTYKEKQPKYTKPLKPKRLFSSTKSNIFKTQTVGIDGF